VGDEEGVDGVDFNRSEEHGFVTEYDSQLYFLRAKAWPAPFGGHAARDVRAEGHRRAARRGVV
jgi:hypothetical protein